MLRKLTYLLSLCLLVLTACKKDENPVPKSGNVVINEIMALNATTVADQDGEYDDWIELYNKSESTVDLTGHYLTDNSKSLTKWRFPNGTTIAGKGYLIVWADNDLDQQGLHASFRLSADGEEVVLVSPDLTILDKVVFGPQIEDVSYARFPNGTGEFSLGAPTFNAENVR
jgi:hypothetical protein